MAPDYRRVSQKGKTYLINGHRYIGDGENYISDLPEVTEEEVKENNQ